MKNNLITVVSFLLVMFLSFQSGCRLFNENSEPPNLILQAPDEADNISVTEPVFGNIYSRGDTLKIKWIAPTIQKTKIQLYRKSDLKITIVQNEVNNGFYYWIIPPHIPISNHYLIKISSQINENIFKFSGQFGIQ